MYRITRAQYEKFFHKKGTEQVIKKWLEKQPEILEAEDFNAREYFLKTPMYGDRRIRTTYEVWSPEAVEAGDTDDRGWLDEEGESMEPDEWDREEGVTAAKKAAKWLNDHGAIRCSSSQFHPGIWSSNGGTEDYRTGDREEHSFHLSGFTEEEEREIWDEVYCKI